MKFKTDSKIPYIIIAFFAVIIIVNLVYIFLSKESWRGIVSKNSYEKGLEYNQTLEQAEEQKKLGWSVALQINQVKDNEFTFFVTPRYSNFSQINDAKLAVQFRRPLQEKDDFITEFKFVDGVYKETVKLPEKGQWDLGVVVIKDDKVYREVKRVTLSW